MIAVRALFTLILCWIGLAASSLAQTASLDVSAPSSTLELYTSLSVSVSGSNVVAGTPSIRVYSDDTEITSSVSITKTSESSEDADQDGLLESYDGSFEVDLLSYRPTPGRNLRVSASTFGLSGLVRAASATEVLANIQVFMTDAIAVGAAAVHVAVLVTEARVQSQSILVTYGGTDVTSLIGITGPELASETVEGSGVPHVRYRMQRYWLDLRALGTTTAGWLTVTVGITDAAGATSSAVATATASPAGTSAGLTPGQTEAVNDLVSALNPSKNSSGQVTVNANASTAKAAADAFSRTVFDPVFMTIPMGQADMKGGTTKIGELDPAAIPTAGPDAAGKVCNDIASGPTITDLTFSIKKGSANSVTMGGGTAVPFSGPGGSATVQLGTAGIGGNQCADYTISGLSGNGSGDDVILRVTPSFSAILGGSSIELNSIPAWKLSAMSDLARNGIAELYHSGVLGIVTNDDASKSLTALAGTVTFPGTPAAALSAVDLRKINGSVVANTSVSLNGNDFTITGFLALPPGETYHVLLVFTDPPVGAPVQVQLRATF